MCFYNQNTLTNIGKHQHIAFYVKHCVEMITTLGGGVSMQGGVPMHDTGIKSHLFASEQNKNLWATECEVSKNSE